MKTKAVTQILVLTAVALSGLNSWAADLVRDPAAMSKAGTPINFNGMIDENNVEKEDLSKAETTAQASAKKEEKKTDHSEAKAVDLLDMEIGWGKNPPPVDRRFNSVGEAKTAEANWRSIAGFRNY